MAGELNKVLVPVSREEELDQIPTQEPFSVGKHQSIPPAAGLEDEFSIKFLLLSQIPRRRHRISHTLRQIAKLLIAMCNLSLAHGDPRELEIS